MRMHVRGLRTFRVDDAWPFVLLVLAVWVAGLAIVFLVTATQPTAPAVHRALVTAPSGAPTRDTAGRRWSVVSVATAEVDGRCEPRDPFACLMVPDVRWG